MDDILSQLPDEDKEKPPFYDTMEIKEGHFIFSLSTAQDLHDLSQWVSEGESTKNAVFVLKNDIDLQNEPFCPIGDEEHPFLGRVFKSPILMCRRKKNLLPQDCSAVWAAERQ